MNAAPAPSDSPPYPSHPPAPGARARPTLGQWARTWLIIGSQSLGGGVSTLLLMRQLLVERHKWVDANTYRDAWAIGQASPGIHIIAMAGLMGDYVLGRRGIVIAIAAMIVPSAFITVLFTAGLLEIEQYPLVQAALRGIIPATGGMTLGMSYVFGASAARSGRLAAIDCLVIFTAAALVGLVQAPIPLILLSAATVGALFLHPRPVLPPPQAPTTTEGA